MIKVSIIVPIYKVEKYLRRCIDSILNQSFKDFEIILVDDGSPDKSGQICEDYAKENSFITVVHKENGGLSSARNVGIYTAKGEYLLFLDADDLLHPNALSILCEMIISEQVQIAIGRFTRFSEFSGLSFESNDINEKSVFSNIQIMERLYNKDGNVAEYVSVCGKLFHKSLFEHIDFPIGKLFEDEYVTYLLYYKADKIAVTDKILYFYFVNKAGITENLTWEKRLDQYEAKWLRVCFFIDRNLNNLLCNAIIDYLNSAQWDLIKYRNNNKQFDYHKGEAFEEQYNRVFKLAVKKKIISFSKDYDYFVLANPQFVFAYRLKRLLFKIFGKM